MTMDTLPPTHPPIPTQIVIDDDDASPVVTSSPSPPTISRQLPLVDEIDLRQCFLFDGIPSASSMQGMVIGKEELNVMCGHRPRATLSFDDAVKHHTGSADCNHHNVVSPLQSSRKGAIIGAEFKACPCCSRYIETFDKVAVSSAGSIETSTTSTVVEQLRHTATTPTRSIATSSNGNNDAMEVDYVEEQDREEEELGSWNLRKSVLTSHVGGSLMSLFNGELEQSCDAAGGVITEEDDFNMAAPPLVRGDKIQHYTITETIVHGWLYKKGSGNDIWGKTWWKPRWVTLALAVFPGQTVPMPLIISHHAPGVPFPAHVMELNESTVVMAIERTTQTAANTKGDDGADIEEWNRHCFQIVTNQHTRIFTADLQERNEWAFVLNKTLRSMEQRLKKARVKEEVNEYAREQKSERKAKRLGMDVLLNDMKEEKMKLEARRPTSPTGRRSIGLPPRVSPPR